MSGLYLHFIFVLIFVSCFCILSNGSPISNSTSVNEEENVIPGSQSETNTNVTVSADINVIRNIFGLLAGGRNTFENITILLQRLSNLFLRAFDGLRFKYTWVKPEIDYIQCGANSLLQANFTNRHFTVLIKIFYEFLGFVKNVFGEGSINIISDDIPLYDDNDEQRSEPSHQLKMAALFEASELMSNSGFIQCSKTYLISFFIRFLQILYGDLPPSTDDN